MATVTAPSLEQSMLQSVPLFATLPAGVLMTLADHIVVRTFERNQVVFHRGDPGEALYVVLEGRVKIGLPGAAGTEITLALLYPGDFFGEMALLDGLPRSASATALDTSRLLILGRDRFLRALQADSRLALAVLIALGNRVRQANQMIEDIVTLDVPARLAKKLLDLADGQGVATPAGMEVQVRLTQGELAALIGATRESTNKVLRGFMMRGWVTMEAHRIVVHKPDELRRRVY